MYLYHFGMRELPFTLTPNTDFFLDLQPHVEALQVLTNALKQGEGFIKVVGEVGTGKTLLCRKLMNDLPDGFALAYIPNPYLTPAELRWAVASELGLRQSGNIDQLQLTQLLQQHLLRMNQEGKTVVVILDEAQALPDESLEALRLLTNLETERRKLIQVVLFGQPELDQRLEQQAFRQLRQRITFSYRLRCMTPVEVEHYIRHRIRCAGYQGGELFSAKLARRIAKASQGIPRLVNILCHKALLLCYGAGEQQVKWNHLKAAISDTDDTSWRATRWWLWAPAVVAVNLLLWWQFNL